MQCNEMQSNAMQSKSMQCNAMQCNAMQCNAMQWNANSHYLGYKKRVTQLSLWYFVESDTDVIKREWHSCHYDIL